MSVRPRDRPHFGTRSAFRGLAAASHVDAVPLVVIVRPRLDMEDVRVQPAGSADAERHASQFRPDGPILRGPRQSPASALYSLAQIGNAGGIECVGADCRPWV